jgi:hypothetical protein
LLSRACARAKQPPPRGGTMTTWDPSVSAGPIGALVAAYHEARLGELVEHVAEAVDRFRANEHDAYAVDAVLHQYSRGARAVEVLLAGRRRRVRRAHRSVAARHGRRG